MLKQTKMKLVFPPKQKTISKKIWPPNALTLNPPFRTIDPVCSLPLLHRCPDGPMDHVPRGQIWAHVNLGTRRSHADLFRKLFARTKDSHTHTERLGAQNIGVRPKKKRTRGTQNPINGRSNFRPVPINNGFVSILSENWLVGSWSSSERQRLKSLQFQVGNWHCAEKNGKNHLFN